MSDFNTIDPPRDPANPVVSFHYCSLCRWMLRTAWMAQEVLQTFDGEVGEVRLRPVTGGVFRIYVDDRLVWDRKTEGGFPDAVALKQRIRDTISPERDLGHVDRARESSEK